MFVVVCVALFAVGAASAAAKDRHKRAHDSAISQYVEVIPSAGGAKPSSGRIRPPTQSNARGKGTKPSSAPPAAANPVSAAFSTSSGGLGGGALLAIILGAIAAAGTVLFAVRRRLGRQ